MTYYAVISTQEPKRSRNSGTTYQSALVELTGKWGKDNVPKKIDDRIADMRIVEIRRNLTPNWGDREHCNWTKITNSLKAKAAELNAAAGNV